MGKRVARMTTPLGEWLPTLRAAYNRIHQPATRRGIPKDSKAEKLMVADSTAIPLYFGRDYPLVRPYVKGVVFIPFGMLDIKRVSLDQK